MGLCVCVCLNVSLRVCVYVSVLACEYCMILFTYSLYKYVRHALFHTLFTGIFTVL